MREIPIGEYIREHRQKKNMTIAKLADGICDASTLSRLERGVHFPSRSKISLLLQRLDLPEDRIIALVSANDLEVRSLKRDIRAEMIRFERADPKDHPALREQILAKLKELLYGREDIFKVLDWKEGSLFILDPLFLFYLRWGGAH